MESSRTAPSSRASTRSGLRTPQSYRVCDGITEAALYFMVIFAPWAFGTTEPWSIWTMNIAGYVLGALLLAKWLIRWRTGYAPMRWGGMNAEPGARNAEAGTPNPEGKGGRRAVSQILTVTLAALTVLVLAYCFVSAVNARATYSYREHAFEPHEYLSWLPHSYDSRSTWQAFWMYLGLAFTFWAARDWLLGMTAKERRGERESAADSAFRVPPSAFPGRLRCLLWLLCLNGAVLALEGILQRLSGTGRLLWLVQPFFNQDAPSQFGPYAYRSNAAQYLNLLWPVCLGFWWTLRREFKLLWGAGTRIGGSPHVMLLPCAVLMAAAPIISTSRGGAIIAVGSLLTALFLLLFAQRTSHWGMRMGIVLVAVAALGLGGYLGWEKLKPRLETIFSDDLSGRAVLYRNAEQIARDYPVFGTGPGTFPWVYHLYMPTLNEEWAGYAHNDWLETRITFGWVGFTPILAMLLIVLLRWFTAGDVRASWLLVAMIWLSLAGCLAHARFDFPFQIYSTLALFLHLCAFLFCLSRRS